MEALKLFFLNDMAVTKNTLNKTNKHSQTCVNKSFTASFQQKKVIQISCYLKKSLFFFQLNKIFFFW